MHRDVANLQKDIASLQTRARGRCAFADLRHLGARTFHRVFRLLHVDADPAVTRIAETDVIAPDFFRGVDRQRVASRAAVHAADENADDFALEIEERRAGFTALRGKIDAQMRGRENSGRDISDRSRRSFRSSATPGKSSG